jgi:cyclophilin family peptidyl-prolyl cis-trans isomerase
MSKSTLFTSFACTLLAVVPACGGEAPAPTEAKAQSKPAEPAPAPKSEPAKVEAPKAEAPKAEAPRVEAPKVEAPQPAAAKSLAPTTDPAILKMREFAAGQTIDKSASNWKTRLPKPPQLEFEAARKYFWVLQTSEGAIKIRLMPDVAPMHVSSTIYLTELGFYDGLTFHRVIPGFMAQGGDPLGKGSGGPGYRYSGEFAPTARHNKPGILSMAHAGPGTDGSQFFLTFGPTPSLDDKHTVFGEVVEGLDNLNKLASFGSPGGPTTKRLEILSATIANE